MGRPTRLCRTPAAVDRVVSISLPSRPRMPGRCSKGMTEQQCRIRRDGPVEKICCGMTIRLQLSRTSRSLTAVMVLGQATHKWEGETNREWGRTIAMDAATCERVDALWESLGIALPGR